MTKFISALLVLASTQAFATGKLVCTGGKIGQDDYKQITVTSQSIEFTMHESSFSISRQLTSGLGNTIAILAKTVTGFAEGDRFKAKVDALLMWDKPSQTMTTTLFLDGNPSILGEILNCK